MQHIEVRRYGHGPRKIVGVHGWFGDEGSFARLEESLDPKHVECAWPALRGIGASRHIPGEYSIAEIASDALEVGWSSGWERFSLVGHSMGGKAALLAAANAPGSVERVLALAPVPQRAEVFPPEVWSAFNAAAEDPASRSEVIQASLGERAPNYWVERLVSASADRADSAVVRSYLRSWIGDDHTETVRGCVVPALGVVGERDPSITKHSVTAEYSDLLVDWRVASVPEAGHYVLDEAPLQVGLLAQQFLLGAESRR